MNDTHDTTYGDERAAELIDVSGEAIERDGATDRMEPGIEGE